MKKLGLAYKIPNGGNKIRQVMIITFLFFLFIALLLFRNVLVLCLLVIVVVLAIMNSRIGDGKIEFEFTPTVIKLTTPYKSALPKDAIVEQIAFSWHYYHLTLGASIYSNSNRQTHSNHVHLKAKVRLKDKQEIRIIQELYPWQDTPKTWNYQVDTLEENVVTYYVNKGLIDLKKSVEQHLKN